MILLRKKTVVASVSVCVLWWVPQHDATTEETDQSDSFRVMTDISLSLVRFVFLYSLMLVCQPRVSSFGFLSRHLSHILSACRTTAVEGAFPVITPLQFRLVAIV